MEIVVRKDYDSDFYKSGLSHNTYWFTIGKKKTEEEEKNSFSKGILKYQRQVKIVGTPTENCQMSTIGSAEGFLCPSLYSTSEMVHIFSKIIGHITTNAVILDIESYLVPVLKEVLEFIDYEDIIFEQEYTNPTGTDMTMLYIHLSECERDDEEWDDDDDED